MQLINQEKKNQNQIIMFELTTVGCYVEWIVCKYTFE